MLSLLKHGKKGRKKMQIFHFNQDKRKKVGWGKELLINTLYGLGIRGSKIADIVGVSRATVYRHIQK